MPIRVDNDLPAREVLESENIFMMGEERADTQQIRPLEIVILNLMPLKQDYEIQLLRALSNTPLQVNVTCMNVSSHVSKHTSASHINKFYTTFEAVRNMYFENDHAHYKTKRSSSQPLLRLLRICISPIIFFQNLSYIIA